MAETQNPVTFKNQAYAVETQVPSLDENSLAYAKRLIGVDYRGARAIIEITQDNIRDFCNYMGRDNPLFLDQECAARTRWQSTIAPPAMVGQAIIAPGLRGIQWIYAGIEWEVFQVMRPGDIISQRGRVTRMYRMDGEHLVELTIWCDNQRGQETAHGTATVALPARQTS